MNEKNTKLKNKYAFKHGIYAVAFTAIVIVAVIILNVLVSALGQRFPLTLDITADKDYSVSTENLAYIRDVERPVTITVCSTEGEYTDYMSQYISYYYSATDETDGKYFDQALMLLDAYTKHNSKIKVVYADPQSPEFAEVQSRVGSSASLSYGSLLVESTFELNGEEVYRNKVLDFDDLYELEDPTGGYASYYGGYVISGSKVESAVTSAIYSVTSDKTTEVGYVSGNMEKGALDPLVAALQDNNYNVTAIDNLVGMNIDEKIEIMVIAAPTSDFSAEELAKLDAFLDNGGRRGKTLLFFASATSPDLPNLYAFLAEWGIQVSTGTLVETNAMNMYNQQPGTMGLQNMATDFTKSVNSLSRAYISGNNLPMKVGFESQGNRVTTQLLGTTDTVTVKPAGAPEDWSAEGQKTETYSAAILSTDTLIEQDFSEIKSYVAVFSSTDFISEYWTQFVGRVGNIELVTSLTNTLSGRDADTVTFTNKTITVESFADQVTGAAVFTIYVLFLLVIPVALIVLGVVIFIRRRNR